MPDSLEGMNCPNCGKIMKKYFLTNVGNNVDVCIDGCGGLYFDNNELKRVEKNALDSNSLVDLLKGKEFLKIQNSLALKCPVCHSKMVKHFTTPSKRNSVDECYFCGGTFIMSDIFLNMMDELKLPPEERENINDFLDSYLPPEMLMEMQKERIPQKSPTILKQIFDSFIK